MAFFAKYLHHIASSFVRFLWQSIVKIMPFVKYISQTMTIMYTNIHSKVVTVSHDFSDHHAHPDSDWAVWYTAGMQIIRSSENSTFETRKRNVYCRFDAGLAVWCIISQLELHCSCLTKFELQFHILTCMILLEILQGFYPPSILTLCIHQGFPCIHWYEYFKSQCC